MNLKKIVQTASNVVRESASCIVVQKIHNECLCHNQQFDYRMLFVKRNLNLKSWPGAMTFPGGVIDKEDLQKCPDFSQIKELPQCKESEISDTEQLYRQTALRELFEETAFPQCENIENLFPWSIWQTPLSYKNRFNAIFYLMFVGTNKFDLEPQEGEIESVHWLSPAEVLNDSCITLAPPQINDISKFQQYKTYKELQKFSENRYKNFKTLQCMPVLAQFRDGSCGIMPQDSFYKNALKLQLKDTSRMIKIDATIKDHNSKQKFLYRSVVTDTGIRYAASNIKILEDGHQIAVNADSSNHISRIKDE